MYLGYLAKSFLTWKLIMSPEVGGFYCEAAADVVVTVFIWTVCGAFFYGQSVENYARKELWILWQLWNSKAQEKKGIRVLMNLKKINISVSKLQTRTSLILHRWQVVLVCERKHKKEEEKKMRPQVNWAGTGMLLLFTVWCRKAIPLTCSNHICPHQGSRFIYMAF